MQFGRVGRGKKDGGGAIIIALLLALVGYLISSLFRFALSRKREYLADAGSAELTHRPLALASALRKISDDPTIEAVKRKDIAQMFIENPQVRDKKSSFSVSFTIRNASADQQEDSAFGTILKKRLLKTARNT